MEKWKEGNKSDNALVRYKAMQFMNILSDIESIEDFDMDMFFRIIEKMTVFEGERLVVTRLDGTEVECEI